MKMNTIWKAEVISPNFTFEAFGATESEAVNALEKGWTNHCKQYGLDIRPILNVISDNDWAWSVEPFKLNSCYRDDHLIKESE